MEHVIPGLQGKGLIHYTTAASKVSFEILNRGIIKTSLSQSYVPPVNAEGDILCFWCESCGLPLVCKISLELAGGLEPNLHGYSIGA